MSDYRSRIENIEAERAALGAMLLRQRAAEDGLGMMEANDFHRPNHALIFEAIRGVVQSHSKVELLTVQACLGHRLGDVGGQDYLTDLTLAVSSAANLRHYAELVLEASRKRKLERMAMDAIESLRGGDETAVSVASTVSALASGIGGSVAGIRKPSEIDETGGDVGLSTGLVNIDAELGTQGWPVGQMSMVLAQEKHGKSTMMVQTAIHSAWQMRGTLYVTLADLNEKRLKRRILRQISGYSEMASAEAFGGVEAFKKAKYELEHQAPFAILDRTRSGGADVDDILSAIEAYRQQTAKTKYPLQVVVIDYAQKLTSRHFKPSEPVSMGTYCSKAISAYAERSGLTIILGSQQTDGSEKAGTRDITKGGRHWLEDLGVCLQMRLGEDLKARATIMVSRFGGTGKFTELDFNTERLRFEEVNR